MPHLSHSECSNPLCSVVVTSFNRADLVRQCLQRLQAVLPETVEFIVSDDGSDADQMRELQRLDAVRLLTSSANLGIGANINRGLAAARAPYAMWVQDDMFLKQGADGIFLEAAIQVLAEHPDIDIVRLLVPYHLEVRERRVAGPWSFDVYDGSVLRSGAKVARVYSDNPHLRRSSLAQRLGPYREMANHGNTELEYAFRVVKCGVKVAGIPGFTHLFSHAGDDRSTQSSVGTSSRQGWRRNASQAKLLAAYTYYRALGRFPDWMYSDRLV